MTALATHSTAPSPRALPSGRFVVQLAARTDARVESFLWYPRVPEYLTLRGTGRQIRIALHRVARPDELLAWIEFYERLGRRAAATGAVRPNPVATDSLAQEPAPTNLSGAEGPHDPFAQSETQPPNRWSCATPSPPRRPGSPRRSPRFAPARRRCACRRGSRDATTCSTRPKRSPAPRRGRNRTLARIEWLRRLAGSALGRIAERARGERARPGPGAAHALARDIARVGDAALRMPPKPPRTTRTSPRPKRQTRRTRPRPPP